MTDRLAGYTARRDFDRTPEPAGLPGEVTGAGLTFVVQKHDATRLHYDLRLEWDGALLSWAVTRGPSADPSERRLAVRTEDHPLAYAGFEGTIPEGEYGGGTVMLWDEGTWEPVGDVAEGLEAGELKMRLHGRRMTGGWALVRMRSEAPERESWLLVKERDDAAEDDPDALTERYDSSVRTGRSMDEIAAGEPPPRRSHAGETPAFVEPQLATLVSDAPEGEAWWHETKFDGYRCLAALGAGGTVLYSRSGKDWTETFGALAGAFDPVDCDAALIDGEVTAARISGGSPFSALQKALSEGGDLVFFAFDLLSLDGEDWRGAPLSARRGRLADLLGGLPPDGPLRISRHVVGRGPEIHAAACEAGAEGIVSKRADAPYRSGRHRAWLKVKCVRRQEFVVGGLSPSDKAGRPFSSLLLGTYEGDALRYRGRVGTGFTDDELARLDGRLRRRETSPFVDVPRDVARDAEWATPDTVVEVAFTEFTAEGHVRHASYEGERRDKPAGKVRAESPADAAGDGPAVLCGVEISSPGRDVFPEAGCTKLDVARHYARVGERMAEVAGHRPLSLVRCPDGVAGDCFYQKHAAKGFPGALQRVEIEEKEGGTAEYLYATRAESFVAAAQMGTVEFHVWGARRDRLDRPDRMVFDLDPGEGVSWETVRDAAFALHDRLGALGLASGALVTGGKGIHVWLPLRRTREWDAVKDFARRMARALAAETPDRFTATMSKTERKGRIFVDWLRNERGATAIAPYSLRARPGAPVAVPVGWDELARLEGPNTFRMADMADRLAAPCPYAELDASPQSLSERVRRALARATGD